MRVISGFLKGRQFDPPASFRSRPTTDFAKENLFNYLNNIMDWDEVSALDLFGGTGSISYELVSRGCKDVVCVEKYAKHTEFIKQTRNKFKIENMVVLNQDFFRFMKKDINQKFDLIFADPPYDMENFNKVPEIIIEKNILNDGGIMIVEHSSKYDFQHLPNFETTKKYGSVNFSIFKFNDNIKNV